MNRISIAILWAVIGAVVTLAIAGFLSEHIHPAPSAPRMAVKILAVGDTIQVSGLKGEITGLCIVPNGRTVVAELRLTKETR